MTERPIIFSAPMVRAILDGRKTQTRRIVNIDLAECLEDGWPSDQQRIETDDTPMGGLPATRFCKYGQPGDRLWVRETWQRNADFPDTRSNGLCVYRADRGGDTQLGDGQKWKPSIYMPRWASRITLEIEDVRVERVQKITEADALAEGVDPLPDDPCAYSMFAMLWDSINAARGYGWSVNPWVWCVTFRRVQP